jgi:hypothetical protein
MEHKPALTESRNIAPSNLEPLESINPPSRLNFQFNRGKATITIVAVLSIVLFLN